MAASDMMSALMELCQEKHIDQLYLIDRLEQSLAKSYAEILHLEWGAKVTIDRTTGKIYVYRLEPIDDSMDEEGNFTEFEEIDVTPKNTSRIAAQHAKAEINAIVRNSAREQIYEEFSGRIGDLISGTVLQSTPDLISYRFIFSQQKLACITVLFLVTKRLDSIYVEDKIE